MRIFICFLTNWLTDICYSRVAFTTKNDRAWMLNRYVSIYSFLLRFSPVNNLYVTETNCCWCPTLPVSGVIPLTSQAWGKMILKLNKSDINVKNLKYYNIPGQGSWFMTLVVYCPHWRLIWMSPTHGSWSANNNNW